MKSFLLPLVVVFILMFTFLKFSQKLSMVGELHISSEIKVIDKNHNGIWDDVESFIRKHGATPEEREALQYKIRSFQDVLLNPQIGTVLKEASLDRRIATRLTPRNQKEVGNQQENAVVDHMMRANACVAKVFGENKKFDLVEIEQAILTTPERIKSYLKFNQNLSGGVYSIWDEKAQGDPCTAL